MAGASKDIHIDNLKAKQIWLRAQGLSEPVFLAEGADAVERMFKQNPEALVLWAHSGFEQVEKVRAMVTKHKTLWADVAHRTDHGDVDNHSERRNAFGPARKGAWLALRVVPFRKGVVTTYGNIDRALPEEFLD